VKFGHEREQEIVVVKEFERKTLETLPEAWSGLKTYGSDVFGAGGITQGCDSLDDWWRRSGQTLNSKLQTLNSRPCQSKGQNQGVPGFDSAEDS
jgi:hypothetical protein